MARRTYRQHLEAISPTLLLGAVAKRFIVGSLSLIADSIAEWSVQSGRAACFTDPSQPADALSLLGEERLSPRYAIDTDATFQARLKNSWERWKQGGSLQGMLDELTAFGVTAELVFDNEWNWDGNDWWSRFWVVITRHPWTGPRSLGDGSELDGTWTLGSSATPEEVDTVRKIVRRWKPAHMKCSHIIVVFDEAGFDSDPPDSTWDKPWNRSEDACYWPG